MKKFMLALITLTLIVSILSIYSLQASAIGGKDLWLVAENATVTAQDVNDGIQFTATYPGNNTGLVNVQFNGNDDEGYIDTSMPFSMQFTINEDTNFTFPNWSDFLIMWLLYGDSKAICFMMAIAADGSPIIFVGTQGNSVRVGTLNLTTAQVVGTKFYVCFDIQNKSVKIGTSSADAVEVIDPSLFTNDMLPSEYHVAPVFQILPADGGVKKVTLHSFAGMDMRAVDVTAKTSDATVESTVDADDNMVNTITFNCNGAKKTVGDLLDALNIPSYVSGAVMDGTTALESTAELKAGLTLNITNGIASTVVYTISLTHEFVAATPTPTTSPTSAAISTTSDNDTPNPTTGGGDSVMIITIILGASSAAIALAKRKIR